MSILSEETPVIARGLSLHKMIRFITFTLGGEVMIAFKFTNNNNFFNSGIS